MTAKQTPFQKFKYKVGAEIILSQLEGGEEMTFTIVGVTKDCITVEDENGRVATLGEPPRFH